MKNLRLGLLAKFAVTRKEHLYRGAWMVRAKGLIPVLKFFPATLSQTTRHARQVLCKMKTRVMSSKEFKFKDAASRMIFIRLFLVKVLNVTERPVDRVDPNPVSRVACFEIWVKEKLSVERKYHPLFLFSSTITAGNGSTES